MAGGVRNFDGRGLDGMTTANGSGTARPGMIPAYEGMLFTVFQQLRQKAQERRGSSSTGLVVAFTSANPGEGVTHTIEALVSGLARYGEGRSLVVTSANLRALRCTVAEVRSVCRLRPDESEHGVHEMDLQEYAPGPLWDSSWEYRRDVLEALRGWFDYVFVDCPALRGGHDVLSVAPFADGVILVVEADRTRREQVLNAEKSIEFARGRLLGHVLNKRRYVVPEWIYRRV
jgi:hypothetical protein